LIYFSGVLVGESKAIPIVIPPTKYGTKKIDVRELSSRALGKIMEFGHVDIIGLGEGIGLAGIVAMLTIAGKKIRIEEIYIDRISVEQESFEAIGIDLRKGEKGAGNKLLEQPIEKPFLAISLRMTREDALAIGCNILRENERVWVAGAGSTMHKVVDVALSLREIADTPIGIEDIRFGTIEAPGKKSTLLAICLSKAAAEKDLVDMHDFFIQNKQEIERTLREIK
jgi:DNA-binding protein